jgi:hypothetical protein
MDGLLQIFINTVTIKDPQSLCLKLQTGQGLVLIYLVAGRAQVVGKKMQMHFSSSLMIRSNISRKVSLGKITIAMKLMDQILEGLCM